MRKWIAVFLAALQLGFGGFLILQGGRADRAREAKIDEILEKGSQFLFSLDSFEYTEDMYAQSPLWLYVYCDGYACYTLSANEQGVAQLTPAGSNHPPEPYLNLNGGETYYRLNEKALHELFKNDMGDSDYHYYSRHWLTPEKNKFCVNGQWVPVYAVGTVYRGDVVYTGLQVGDVIY